MTHHTVLEWGRVDVGENGFSRHQADRLLAAARAHRLGGADGTDILCDHHRFLRARQTVGVIAAKGCSLEILPKVDGGLEADNTATLRGHLVHMLDVAHGLNLSSGEATTMSRRAESLLDIFIALFADQLLAEVRRGLPRQYHQERGDLATVRGRLNIGRQFTTNIAYPNRIACSFDALDADTPLLRIMKACVLILAQYAKASTTQRKLAELRFLMADISDISPRALPWQHVRIDRSNQRWRALLELAKLLLASSWQNTHAERAAPDGITLLFPMHELFERYVAVQLKRALSDTGLSVESQGGGAYCLGPWTDKGPIVGDSHPTRPDIILKRDDQIFAIIDTKWKPAGKGVVHADIYQMMAYARLYACPRLILLYPEFGNAAEVSQTRGIALGQERLDIRTLCLTTSGRNVQNSLRRLVADTSI